MTSIATSGRVACSRTAPIPTPSRRAIRVWRLCATGGYGRAAIIPGSRPPIPPRPEPPSPPSPPPPRPARRWGTRGLVACLALLLPGLALYALLTRGASSGLSAYWETWRNNALIFDVIERATGRYAVARAVALAGVLGAGVYAWMRFHAA